MSAARRCAPTERRLCPARRVPPVAAYATGKLLAALSALAPGRACADPPRAPAHDAVRPSAPRALPDYDGRGTPPVTAARGALWVPRVLLAPLYLVSEYVVRRPLGWLIATADRNHWPTLVLDFLGIGEKVGFIPTAFLDFGLRPSVGVYFFWDDFLVRGNALRVRGATWGLDWLTLAVTDRVRFADGRAMVALRGEATRREDQVFAGPGPRSRESDRARYGADWLEASGVFEATPWRSSRVRAASGVRRVRFSDAACCDEPSVVARASQGTFALPPGFREGYDVHFARVDATLDTRAPDALTASGARVGAFAEHAVDLDAPAARRWVRYGGAVGGFLDVTGARRTLGLFVEAAFADPLAPGEVPFTELAQLGGDNPLRGFLPGRLVGRSAVAATLEYRWPVWVWLDGTMHLAVGNVFGPHLDGFDPELLRMSFGIGLRTRGRPDHSFDMLVAFGTDTFEQGAEVTSMRLVLGARHGF